MGRRFVGIDVNHDMLDLGELRFNGVVDSLRNGVGLIERAVSIGGDL